MSNRISSSKKLKEYFIKSFSELRKDSNNLKVFSKYFNEVGSTETEDVKYSLQVSTKLTALKLIFKDIVQDNILEQMTISPSVLEERYRFKMEFVTIKNPLHEPFNRFGQRKRKNFSWVVDIDDSILVKKDWFEKTRKVYEYAKTFNIENYNLKTEEGILRYFTLKEYQDHAILIITIAKDIDQQQEIGKFALDLGFESVYFVLNNTKQDTSEGEVLINFGSENLTINLNLSFGEYQFKVGPFTFFQNNIDTFKLVIEEINNFINSLKTKDVQLIDAYCGVGMFGILFAKHFKNVIGFDIVPENIKAAQENAKQNNIEAEFVVQDLTRYEVPISDNRNILIVDPARPGLGKNAIEQLLKFNPEYIIYLSCNPITQASDLEIILGKYEVILIKGFDFYPQTYHMENLIILKRLSSYS